MTPGTALVVVLPALCLAGIVLHLLLLRGISPMRYQEQRLRAELLPAISPQELVTCRPRSGLVLCGPLLASIGGILSFAFGAIAFYHIGSALELSHAIPYVLPKHVSLATGAGALAGIYAAFCFLRLGSDVFLFDCVTTDTRLYWRKGIGRRGVRSCPIEHVTDMICKRFFLIQGVIWTVTLTLRDGSTLRLFGLENEAELFEALGFESPPPPALRPWISRPARRRIF